jgi:hypothetical protein
VDKEALEWIEEEKQTNVSLAKAETDMFNTCKKISECFYFFEFGNAFASLKLSGEKNDCETAAKMFMCAKEIYKKVNSHDICFYKNINM